MNKNASKKSIWSYVYDHYLVLLGTILGVIGFAIVYFLRGVIEQFIGWQYSGWLVAAILVLGAILFAVIRKKRHKFFPVGIVNGPPRYKHEEYDPIERYGVSWELWRGNNVPSAFDYALGDTPLIVWVDGPFCLECNYEMEQNGKRTRWVCANGHKYVKIPKALRGDVRDRMMKIFEAELRRQRIVKND